MKTGKLLLLPVFLVASIISLAQTGPNTPWYWRNGDYIANRPGIYAYDPLHPFLMPGSRSGSASWTGTAGELWLYGGDGYDANNVHGYLSDLWKYSGTQWTFVKGNPIADIGASYGTQGIASNSNTPGSRAGIASWSDNNGNLWLFGGNIQTTTNWLFFNDLWKYDPSINQWAWMHGDNTFNQVGNYGTIGVASPTNKPGARSDCITWKDNAGCFWLFGGKGPNDEFYNDLWKFEPQTNQWTWIKGASFAFEFGTYGSQNVPDAANKPGARFGSAYWMDLNGKLWLFGGIGFGESFNGGGTLSDLWRYDPSSNEWTWIKGDKIVNEPAVYGTLGAEAISNKPGARAGSYNWVDELGNLWLFGGTGYGLYPNYPGNFNDLWKFNLLTGQWTWMKGSQLPDQAGDYNVGGIPGFINHPGSRSRGESWTTPGTFWMFGGFGSAISPGSGYLNDLWTLWSTQLNILPVTLNNFWGTVSGYKVCLYWQASQEENFSHYNLQRSHDAIHYSNVAVIPGKGAQVGFSNLYTYEDVEAIGVMNGKLYYRLEMVDRNGFSRFSTVVVISDDSTGSRMDIYPNPANKNCNLVIENNLDASAQLVILSSNGMTVDEKMLKLAKGRNVFILNLDKYPAGVYVVRIRTSQGWLDKKMVVQ